MMRFTDRRRLLSPMPNRYLAILSIFVCITIYHFSATFIQSRKQLHCAPSPTQNNDAHPQDISRYSEDASNETLGFQKIFYLSLPFRTDRQDGISLISSFTGIKVTLLDGVSGEEVHPKARPPGADMTSGALGCWRSHANAWKKIIEEDIQTALILEDDADWDVAVKDQFYQVSQAILAHPSPVTNETSVRLQAPYRTDWDIFFVGACDSTANKKNRGPVISFPDATVPNRDTLQERFQEELRDYGVQQDGIRAIARAFSTLCTTGYAVTKRGAQRLLYNVGYKRFGLPVDNEMSWAIQDGRIRGLVVSPPLIGMFKIESSRDSDNMDIPDGVEIKGADEGYTLNLKDSARQAMKAWVAQEVENYW